MDQLSCIFLENYGTNPTVYVSCPGRVNLIGEHIDYHGYGVLPMAIEETTNILAALNGRDEIRMINVNKKYPSFSLTLPSLWSGSSPPSWFDYVLSGWKGMMLKLGCNSKGFDLLIEGSVPESSGLSSSSSVVCAAALTTWAIHTGKGFDGISREELAELCALAEQYVGTHGGGMDQACEILSQKGSALHINFHPLRSQTVSLPPSALFVVLHCGQTLNKAATSQYNQRVVEGRIAAKLLQQELRVSTSSVRLKDIQETAEKTLEEMLVVTEKLPEQITRNELEQLLDVDVIENCLSEDTKHMTSFTIRSRAHHVFSEALRVDKFAKACQEENLTLMGTIMNQSHTSCSKDYECSCEALDNLVSECLLEGAYGVRLTGAGWGGCVIALVDKTYQPIRTQPNFLFCTSPSDGIRIRIL